jgi:hypothetical protein
MEQNASQSQQTPPAQKAQDQTLGKHYFNGDISFSWPHISIWKYLNSPPIPFSSSAEEEQHT